MRKVKDRVHDCIRKIKPIIYIRFVEHPESTQKGVKKSQSWIHWVERTSLSNEGESLGSIAVEGLYHLTLIKRPVMIALR